jgi:putative SOS response-associated peptidase YedK
MCAEFVAAQAVEIEELLKNLTAIRNIIRQQVTGRVYPRGSAPIIVPSPIAGAVDIIEAEFSLIPHWWDPSTATKKTKSGRPVFATHNARVESIAEKPAFRDAFKKSHCVVPFKKFYESSVFGSQWAGNRIGIESENGELFLAAGLMSEWLDKSTGESIPTFTIITTIPAPAIFDAGHDRMPMFLTKEDSLIWVKRPPDISQASQSSLTFLHDHHIGRSLDFNIILDRPLKDGWQKNSPSDQEIADLQRRVLA